MTPTEAIRVRYRATVSLKVQSEIIEGLLAVVEMQREEIAGSFAYMESTGILDTDHIFEPEYQMTYSMKVCLTSVQATLEKIGKGGI